MSKRILPPLRAGLRIVPMLAALVLLGCGSSKQAVSPQQTVPARQLDAGAGNQVPALTVSAADRNNLQRRYQCPTAQGVEALAVLYQGSSPFDAAALTLQRGSQSFALSRHPSVRGLFIANDEKAGYRWVVAENGVGTLRVRAPIRSAVETEVLAECQPI